MLDARRRRARRHRENGRGGREALRPLSLGPLRRARAAAVLPVRRHGEPDPHLPDADLHRRRQEPGQPRRPRAGAQLVGQPRHQRGPGPTSGSTKASPPISRTGSWRRSTARRARSQEAALASTTWRRRLREDGPDMRRHPPAPRRRGRSPGRRRDRHRLRQGRGLPAHDRTPSSAATRATPICAPISTAMPSSR